MSPSEPPPLSPSDSDPVLPTFSTIPRAQRRARIILAFTAVLFSAAVAGIAGLLLYADTSPQAVVADALEHLENTPNIQVNGSLLHDQPGSADITFTASKQPQSIYVDVALTAKVDGEPTETPIELFVTSERVVYLKVHGTDFFDGLVRDANPADALRILHTQAIFSSQLQDKWLRLTSDEMRALREKPTMQSTQLLPTQECLARISNDPQFLADVGAVLAMQSIEHIDEGSGDKSELHYRIVMMPDDMQLFNECFAASGGAGAPGLIIDMWINAEERRFNKVQFAFRSEEKRLATFELTADYGAFAAKQVPESAVTLKQAGTQTVAEQAAVDDAFLRHLSAFPSLEALVRELEALEVE